jgi:ATP-dependent Lhr-like helicase
MHEARKAFTWLASEGTVVVRGKNDAAAWWTFAGTGANATLASELSQMTQSRVTHDSFTVIFESHVSFQAIEQALSELRLIEVSEMCVAVDERALAGLKFSECLPHDLALDMLRTRLSDLPAGQWVLGQPVRVVQV